MGTLITGPIGAYLSDYTFCFNHNIFSILSHLELLASSWLDQVSPAKVSSWFSMLLITISPISLSPTQPFSELLLQSVAFTK
jgi:hypothetical protein